MSASPLTSVIIGAGHRSFVYASHATRHPDELRIVGLAEPDPVRQRQAIERFNIPKENVYATAEELAAAGQFADVAINGTMDALHVATTLPLLEAGYDVLLEKPITPRPNELRELVSTVQRTGRKLMIGHVLRYAPFYVAIKEKLNTGIIGDLLMVRTTERVSYHHMAVVFVRGKWNRREDQSPMLLAKCCHDLDLICWMKSGVRPERVGSFGALTYFREQYAPEGSGERCLVDCRIEPDCPYSAKKHYLEMGLWPTYVWHGIEHIENPTLEDKIESLKTDNPHGRCVWRCDNDVVDHQSVQVDFADGSVATHSMMCGSAKPGRTMHLFGTEGEIEGWLEDGKFVIRHPDPRKGHETTEELIDLSVSGDMHGGGDYRLAADFVAVCRGQQPSISSTNIMDSVNSHLIAFAADDAMLQRRVVDVEDLTAARA